MVVLNSVKVTHKSLTQIMQMIFHHQKRNFKLSAIDTIEKKAPSVHGSSAVIDQSAPGVAGISEKSTLINHEISHGTDSSKNNPEMNVAKHMHSVSGNPHIQGSYDYEVHRPVVLEDLQVDVPSRIHEPSYEQNARTLEMKDFIQGQQNRHVDPTTVKQVYYFNTLAYVKKLEAKGFTREQAEVCVDCLVEIINSTLDHQAKHMITKSQQEIVVQQLLSEITSVKKDMVLLQKSEFSSLRSETEKIGIDMNRIETHFQDEVVKLKGQFSLDINLERGRAVEAHAENEKKLQLLHNKIDTEIANLKTTYEIYRNDVIKFAGGTVLTCATLILGFIRLWK